LKLEKLNTARLYLRRFEINDLDFVYKHFSDSNVSKYLYDNEPPANIDEAKNILDWCIDIKAQTHIRWCISLKNNGIPIGTVGFHNYDKTNNAAEIGYDLSEDHWNQGYMSEALSIVLNYGFELFNLNRIYAYVYISNESSNRLLDKLGFKLEGIIRDKHLFRGVYYDHNLFSILKAEKANYK
jgi:ribosomal-protein-alanine N-acetyltransferase